MSNWDCHPWKVEKQIRIEPEKIRNMELQRNKTWVEMGGNKQHGLWSGNTATQIPIVIGFKWQTLWEYVTKNGRKGRNDILLLLGGLYMNLSILLQLVPPCWLMCGKKTRDWIRHLAACAGFILTLSVYNLSLCMSVQVNIYVRYNVSNSFA